MRLPLERRSVVVSAAFEADRSFPALGEESVMTALNHQGCRGQDDLTPIRLAKPETSGPVRFKSLWKNPFR